MKKLLVWSVFISLLTTILATQFSCDKLQKNEFERNRRLWRESNIKNYKMTVDLQKTGHARPMGRFVIVARDGAVKSIKNKDNIELSSGGILRFDGLKTLDDIFNFIEQADNDMGIWDIKVIQYDEKLGYPKMVNLDKSGSLDDEIYFEVLQFEIEESSDDKTLEKTSSPKVISVLATEITKAEFSDRSRDDQDWSGMSFSKDGTAFRAYRPINFETNNNKSLESKKYQGVVSQEQFQKFAQTIAENDFSNLEDATKRNTDSTDRVLTIIYSGKMKFIKTSDTDKNSTEVNEILNAFEKLKNQIDWIEIK